MNHIHNKCKIEVAMVTEKNGEITSMKINTSYLAVIGILIFTYILSTIDTNKIITAVSRANTYYIALALSLAIVSIILKSLKWKYVMDTHNIKISVGKAIKIWTIGSFVGWLTPGRSGEIIKVYYLKDKYHAGTILSTIAIDRISDIIALFILSIIGTTFLFFLFKINLAYLTVLIIIAIIASYFFTKERTARLIAKPIYTYFIPESKKNAMKDSYKKFFSSFERFKKNIPLVVFTLSTTIIIWSIGITQAYLVTQSLGLDVSYTYLFSIIPLSMIITILPITIAGIGTREATFIFFFSLINITAENAIAYTMIEFGILLFSMSIGGFMLFYEKKKINI